MGGSAPGCPQDARARNAKDTVQKWANNEVEFRNLAKTRSYFPGK